MEGLHLNLAELISDRPGGELAAVVGADVIRSSVPDKELGDELQQVV
jgi:hypothetical protein